MFGFQVLSIQMVTVLYLHPHLSWKGPNVLHFFKVTIKLSEATPAANGAAAAVSAADSTAAEKKNSPVFQVCKFLQL